MKKIITLLLGILLFVSCGTTRYINLDNTEASHNAVTILYNRHPELVKYYEDNVLLITSMKEIRTDFGYDYDIRYRFIKYYYKDYTERMLCLKERFPELYVLYTNGAIEITSIYKYVDDYGEIRYHVSYRNVYDSYYYSYPNVYPHIGRYYYRSRPVPNRMSPPPPPPKPKPDVKPNDRPNPQRHIQPSNPPKQGGGNQQVRPNNPQRQGGSNQQVRPNTRPQTRQSNPSSSRSNTQPRSSSGNGVRRR